MMEIIVDCNCGKELSIAATSTTSKAIIITVDECERCAKTNYDAGEADGGAIARC